jgi:hypothetical protein
MHVAVIDIGKPGKNFGWSMAGPRPSEGEDIDDCIKALALALNEDGLALGFEAPMFVPMRQDPAMLLAARNGECGKGRPSRPFSAGAGPTALVTALVVVPYVLTRLRSMAPKASATLDWRSSLRGPKHLLLFEAFVTNQRKTVTSRHIEDARLAVAAFQSGMTDPATFESSVIEPDCLNLLSAMMLRTQWSDDPGLLQQPCLVVRA